MRKRGPKPQTETFPGYIRYAEAKKVFSPFDSNALNYRVRCGDIKVVEDELGRMYELESMLNIRQALIKKQEEARSQRKIEVIYDWFYPEDVPAVLALDQVVYHEMYLADMDIYQSWRKKNPQISMAAFDKFDRRICYAYMGLLPLEEPTIIEVLLGKKDEKDITSDDIIRYDHPGEFTVLANSAVHHPDHPELMNGLIGAITNHWYDWFPEKRIKRIYAQTVSDEGRLMASKLCLGPLYTIHDHKVQRVPDAYVLDMDVPAASRIIRGFQEKLKLKGREVG